MFVSGNLSLGGSVIYILSNDKTYIVPLNLPDAQVTDRFVHNPSYLI